MSNDFFFQRTPQHSLNNQPVLRIYCAFVGRNVEYQKGPGTGIKKFGALAKHAAREVSAFFLYTRDTSISREVK